MRTHPFPHSAFYIALLASVSYAALPSGYVPIDYIEMCGKQYINTGIYPDRTLRVRATFSTTDTENDKVTFGVRHTDYVFLCWFSKNPGSTINPAIGTSGNLNCRDTGKVSGEIWTLDMGPDGAYAGDTQIYSAAEFSPHRTTTRRSSKPLLLFGLSNNGSVDDRKYVGRCYDFKAYKSEILVRDMRPALRVSDDVAGLYDLVEGVFYPSATATAFAAGPRSKMSQTLEGGPRTTIRPQPDQSSDIDSGRSQTERANVVTPPRGDVPAEKPMSLAGSHAVAARVAPLALDTSALTNAWNGAGISDYKCKAAFRDFGKAVADANAAAVAQRTKLDTTARLYLKQQMEKAQEEGDLDTVLVFKAALEAARGGTIVGKDEAIVKLRESYGKQLVYIGRTLVGAGVAAARVFDTALDGQKMATTKKGDINDAKKIAAFQKKVGEWTMAVQGQGTQVATERPGVISRPKPQPSPPAREAKPPTPEANGADKGPLMHRWSFNGNLMDSAGGQNARIVGDVAQGLKSYRLKGGSHGSSYIDLGPNILPRDGRSATVEIWATSHCLPSHKWGRVFDIGSRVGDYMVMTWCDENPNDGYSTSIVSIAGVTGTNRRTVLGALEKNREYHLAMVCSHEEDGSWLVTFYLQDATSGKTLSKVCINSKGKNWSLMAQGMLNCWLGHSQWEKEMDASASYNEVRVWAAALTEQQLTESARRGPDALITPNTLSRW